MTMLMAYSCWNLEGAAFKKHLPETVRGLLCSFFAASCLLSTIHKTIDWNDSRCVVVMSSVQEIWRQQAMQMHPSASCTLLQNIWIESTTSFSIWENPGGLTQINALCLFHASFYSPNEILRCKICFLIQFWTWTVESSSIWLLLIK